jgi:hypothetical protein
MITVRDRLNALAETEFERMQIAVWMDGSRDDHCARQRAWQAVDARRVGREVRFRW